MHKRLQSTWQLYSYSSQKHSTATEIQSLHCSASNDWDSRRICCTALLRRESADSLHLVMKTIYLQAVMYLISFHGSLRCAIALSTQSATARLKSLPNTKEPCMSSSLWKGPSMDGSMVCDETISKRSNAPASCNEQLHLC